MQIKDPERFKTWLTAVLGPICEAEPAALAKYIFALLKRDRPINELQKFLVSQLEEFLNNETEVFATQLVETLRNESYLNEDPIVIKEINCEASAGNSSGEKSDTGEKPIEKPIKEENPRSRSRSLVRSRSPKTKDVKFTRSKRYRRDNHTSDEDEERESYRNYRYHGRSWSPRRSKSPKFKRRFRSPKNRSRSHSGSPVKKPKEDIFAAFKKSESIEKKTLGRCIDFDEKGYCMKGDLCVYDHGKDPVVLATGGNGVLSFQNPGASFNNPLAPAFPVVPIVQNVPVSVPVQPYPPAQNQRMYYPSTEGSYWVRGSGEQKFSKQKRELVSVPTGENLNRFKRKNFKKEDNNFNNNKKPKFDYRRLGPKVSSNEVQLKNVPENLNNISSLNNSFMKFGKITNIQTSSENKEATITFSASHEAQKAYQNIETVFGTLPITAHWFADNSVEVKPPEDKNITAQKPKMLSLDNRITTPTRLTNEKEAEVIKSSLIKKQEEAKKLAQHFSATITKRKQELLDKQLDQLNKLLVAAPNVKGEQKQVLMATINQLKTNIENIQVDLASAVRRPVITRNNVKVIQNVPPKTPTKEDKLLEVKREALKNLLLTDLDLFVKQQQGYSDEKEILDLKKNVMILRSKLKGLGITSVSIPAKTAYQMKEKLAIANKLLEAKNKVRETKTTSISVDHRPTQLLISGYEVDDEDQVVTHFLQFGNILEYISDTIIPALVIKYEMRKDAETAQIKGKLFQDRRLSVTWYNSQHDFVDTSKVKAGPCMGAQLEENSLDKILTTDNRD